MKVSLLHHISFKLKNYRKPTLRAIQTLMTGKRGKMTLFPVLKL